LTGATLNIEEAALPLAIEAPHQPVVRMGVFHDVEAAEPCWRELEASAVSTPYQSPEWIGAWVRHALQPGERVAILAGLDALDRAVFLLPLGIMRVAGIAIARPFGGKQANYHLPLFRRDGIAGLDGREVARGIVEAARGCGVDAVVLPNQPREWMGRDNPLTACGGFASPDSSFRVDLCTSAEERSAGLSRGARRKLKQKERMLAEHGDVTFGRATTPHMIKRTLDAHLAQKEAWFRRRGRPNLFAEPRIDTFLRAAALSGLSEDRAGMEVYYLAAGDRIVATFAGAARHHRFSGMILSADICNFGRSSPGELLLSRVTDLLIERGIAGLDLGIGDSPYKRALCPVEEHLFDLALPVTPAGRVFAQGWYVARRAKRWAKHSPLVARLQERATHLRCRAQSETAAETH
jgi:CelD/BcsL family acetyltransferase involved in cellulose biosynthesis